MGPVRSDALRSAAPVASSSLRSGDGGIAYTDSAIVLVKIEKIFK